MTLLKVKNLTKLYSIEKKILKAVDHVSFEIERGETLGLVGESGCGKSTLGRMLLGLIPPTSGQIFFDGQEIGVKRDLSHRRKMQMIFQDPSSSLNPRMSIGDLIAEPLKIHRLPDRLDALLDLVGLPRFAKGRFPHEFSGGQKQRIGIARALSLNPEFLVCDEPVSSLDISIAAQILNLLLRLQKELQLTLLFISHDFAIIKAISTRVAVMYFGQFVETAPTADLYSKPLHPYTQALLASIPTTDPREERNRIYIPVQGEMPSPLNPPKGCPFSTRCPFATSQCKTEVPLLREVAPGHRVACHLVKTKVKPELLAVEASAHL